MMQYEKILLRFLENPENTKLTELLKILDKNGFSYCGGKGSHRVYKNNDGKTIVLPVHNNQIKKVYKIQVKKLIF
jgi:predicted RNA binding protein YcfA (HicA-like mRNA interferase family)